MFPYVEPPHSFVRGLSASVVHHVDYLERRENQALCGAAVEDATELTGVSSADTVCPDCETKLVLYHLQWWREQALAATAELEALRAKYGEPAAPAQVEPQSVPVLEPAESEPTTPLERARRELIDLCRQFDDAVPYIRLKNTMQAFSDRLESDERALLAQEIGNDGTLIRWSTMEVEVLGLHVSNSPVQGDSEATWDAWVQDPYPAARKSKRRFGRSR
ncbi:hypothetical protein BST36_00330 [Mycolicibacterium moriokaense]|nr:hypothetical protein [Mycolicibacterium moriokaense]MCV7041232.1 hypothetical protein [Mycolicibacterium moriokaense]ORB27426.1 hypothetical protein BST36_00330 [Mycolicibacterium moriokaense]